MDRAKHGSLACALAAALLLLSACGARELEYDAAAHTITYEGRAYRLVEIPAGRSFQCGGSGRRLGRVGGDGVYAVKATDTVISTHSWDGYRFYYCSTDPEALFTMNTPTGLYVDKRYYPDAEAAELFLSVSKVSAGYDYGSHRARYHSFQICYDGTPIGTVSPGLLVEVDGLLLFSESGKNTWGGIVSDTETLAKLKPYLK